MKYALIIIGILILIGGIGYVVTSSDTSPTPVLQDTPNTNTQQESQEESSDEQDSGSAGTYTTYDSEKIADSNADHILLFFHATWCPSCRALDANIVANSSTIPSDVEIYKVDYDTSTDLKRQYGITTQHSLIEISADGTAQSSVTHPQSLADILQTL